MVVTLNNPFIFTNRAYSHYIIEIMNYVNNSKLRELDLTTSTLSQVST